MACEVRILPSAHEELAEIVGYLASRSRRSAQAFLKAYQEKCDLLASGTIDYGLSHLPELARLGYHACRVSSYALLYYHDGDAVVIAHVFHGSRNYARLVLPPQRNESNESEDD